MGRVSTAGPMGVQGPARGQQEEGVAMKYIFIQRLTRFVTNLALPLAMLSLLCTAVLPVQLLAQRASASQPAGKQLKLVLARQSTADPVEIMKHLSQNCPNISLTTNLKTSDYMLYAGGWSGSGYRFLVIAKGGDTIYGTQTVLLSNAVKNVCTFLKAR